MVTTKRQIVPGAPRTSSGTNPRKYITVHQTGNPSAGADAQAHANLQSRGGTGASWHWQADDAEAIQSYEHTARCWHAGDGSGDGNMSSIGVEICINSDGDYSQSVRNGAELVAKIAEAEGIPTSRIVQHNHWSGKDCPTQLRDGKAGISWSDFLKLVDRARAGGADRDDDREPVDEKDTDVDGKWGSDTTRWLQKRLAEVDLYTGTVDGRIDSQNAHWRDDNPGLTTGWDWQASGYDGSRTIRGLQAVVGVKADGLIGPDTIRALQKWLTKNAKYDGAIDGQLWKPSTTVKALQKVLNSKRGFKR